MSIFDEQAKYDQMTVGLGQLGTAIYHVPITQRLKDQLAALEDRRVKVQALLDLIESNPQFEQLYDLTREVL